MADENKQENKKFQSPFLWLGLIAAGAILIIIIGRWEPASTERAAITAPSEFPWTIWLAIVGILLGLQVAKEFFSAWKSGKSEIQRVSFDMLSVAVAALTLIMLGLEFFCPQWWGKLSGSPIGKLLLAVLAIIAMLWYILPGTGKITTGIGKIFCPLAGIAVIAVILFIAAGNQPEEIFTKMGDGIKKPKPVCAAPRDISWMTFKITPVKQDLFRVYAGDTIYYFADKGFWVEYEDGNKYFNNPSYDGQMMEFTITTANEKGEIARVWSDETLQLKFRVKSRG